MLIFQSFKNLLLLNPLLCFPFLKVYVFEEKKVFTHLVGVLKGAKLDAYIQLAIFFSAFTLFYTLKKNWNALNTIVNGMDISGNQQ